MIQAKTFLASRLSSRRGWRRIRAGLLILALAATGVVASPAPAMAEPNFYEFCGLNAYKCQNGAKVHSPGTVDYGCGTGTYAETRVCISYYGDYVYVYDGLKDGNSALGGVLVTGGGDFKLCRNRHGYGTWAKCNFNWIESRTKHAYGGLRYSYRSIYYEWLWTFSGK